mgnify:CR=1 FL=1
MKITKPIEIDTKEYSLRLEGTILTVTLNGKNEITSFPETTVIERLCGHGCINGAGDINPWAIIADLIREMGEGV